MADDDQNNVRLRRSSLQKRRSTTQEQDPTISSVLRGPSRPLKTYNRICCDSVVCEVRTPESISKASKLFNAFLTQLREDTMTGKYDPSSITTTVVVPIKASTMREVSLSLEGNPRDPKINYTQAFSFETYERLCVVLLRRFDRMLRTSCLSCEEKTRGAETKKDLSVSHHSSLFGRQCKVQTEGDQRNTRLLAYDIGCDINNVDTKARTCCLLSFYSSKWSWRECDAFVVKMRKQKETSAHNIPTVTEGELGNVLVILRFSVE